MKRYLKKLWTIISGDVRRMLPMIVLGFAFVFLSTPFALWVNESTFSAWGLFIGGSFFTGALTHAMRRLLFPGLELTALIAEARKTPQGAGLVVLGICILLAAFVMLFGAATRT
ncbi:MAG TPA: hypothetical protein VGC12_00350 [Methyloradius sp.]